MRHIYTVSKLTREIKSLLEDTYPFIWVTGEISNYAVPASGHSYFTLKDQQAVISGVMFKNQKRSLQFELGNGLKINGLARLTLYEPRGSYQLIFEHLEPAGAGSMQLAFEQLKQDLAQKGFFEENHKKSIPFLSSHVSIITSGTGAAVRDIVIVAKRRFSNCRLEIVPVKVQGKGSEDEISQAINFVNDRQKSDLIILARGGGSLEDLSAFNSRKLATAIFESRIPVLTGVGHETDFTIADFVADLRAPTPSAAAELAFPDKMELIQKVLQIQDGMQVTIQKYFLGYNQMVRELISRLKTPETLIYDFRFRLEDHESRLFNVVRQSILHNSEKLGWLTKTLYAKKPETKVSEYRKQVKIMSNYLTNNFQKKFHQFKTKYIEVDTKLIALNPEQILKRGYSISRFVSDKSVIKDSSDVKKNDKIQIILSKGQLITKVEKVNG